MHRNPHNPGGLATYAQAIAAWHGVCSYKRRMGLLRFCLAALVLLAATLKVTTAQAANSLTLGTITWEQSRNDRSTKQINREDGMTVVCSLHFLSLARRYASRVVALKAGALVFDGPPALIDQARFGEIYGEEAADVEIS